MRITMVGSGYVGLVSGACFADFGHDVCCVDKDQDKIDLLLAGTMPIYEPGLDQLVNGNVAATRSSGSSARQTRRPTSRSSPTPSSCARVLRSTTSSAPTGSSSVPTTRARWR